MTFRFNILIIIFLSTVSIYGQTNIVDRQKLVLEKGIVDSLFIFGRWTEGGQTDETQLKYLGQVKTNDGSVYKIMNCTWIWGLSERCTSRILVFDNSNKYLGNYIMNMDYELPEKLINGKLIFSNKKCNMGKIHKPKVDLSKGIPKQFFINCFGSFFTFEQ